ncbi:inositol monophosphatase family protein [Pseudomonas aeruginosa]
MQKIDLIDLLDRVVTSVEAAGELLIAEWARPEGPRGSGYKAEVDLEIEQFLRPELLHFLDCDFWGEETGQIVTGHRWCWAVDPNDGTGDFLNRRIGSSVSVGLLRDSIPVLGVVYAPVTDELGRDCIAWAEGLPHLLRNGRAVANDLSQQHLSGDARVMVSAAAASKPRLNAELCSPAQFIPMPSIAYRLARVAAGDGVCAVSLYPLSAHDVVAGHALLRASRGVLLKPNGDSINYGAGSNLGAVASGCFGGAVEACSSLLVRDWGRALRQDET